MLGREWKIFNGDGSLHREIRRGSSESRMVVGLQPILEPGDSFIYHSGTDVKSSSGTMEGSFQVHACCGYTASHEARVGSWDHLR